MNDLTTFYALYKLILLILGGILIRLILFPLLPPTLQDTLKQISELYTKTIHDLLTKITGASEETLDEKLLYSFITPLTILIVSFAFIINFLFQLQGFYTLKYFALFLFTSTFIFLLPSQAKIQNALRETTPTELAVLSIKTITTISILFMAPVIPAWMTLSIIFIPIPRLNLSPITSPVELL